MEPLSLFGIERQNAAVASELSRALERVRASGSYILGEEVEALEREVADFVGAGHAVGVSSGSDALVCSLAALGCGPGSEVLVPAFSFFATVESVLRVGAKPRLVDIDLGSLAMDVEAASHALGAASAAILAVHLYGCPARLAELVALAEHQGVALVEDAAQAFGASFQGRRVGSWGTFGCFSFFPTKPLGGLGDGGMVVAHDAALAARVRRLRVHGAVGKHRHVEVGGNFRLDALQAAVLREKLPHVESWRARRAEHARRYREALGEVGELALLSEEPDAQSAHALFTLRVLDGQRDALQAHLEKRGIQAGVYYPRPLHAQPALAGLGTVNGQFPNAELASREVLSLPLYAELTPSQVDRVVHAVREYFL